IVAVLAIPELGTQNGKLESLAARAFRASWPTETLKKFSAFFIIGKDRANVYDGHRGISRHG
ncbi:MAG TPA: hypothetical protein VI488_13085, partial [Candidatus Angelobacter sp.]